MIRLSLRASTVVLGMVATVGGLVLAAPVAQAQTHASCASGTSFFGTDIEATGCAGIVDHGASYVISIGTVSFQRPFHPGQWIPVSNVVFTCNSVAISNGGSVIQGAPCSSNVLVH